MPFGQNNYKWVCPACRNSCSCDVCTRKRGEVYVSLRAPRRTNNVGEQVVTRGKNSRSKKGRRDVWSSSEHTNEDDDVAGWSSDEDDNAERTASSGAKKSSVTTKQALATRVAKPLPPTPIVGAPGTHWGAVYALTGERMGAAYVGEGNRSVKISISLATLMRTSGVVHRKRRVFAGGMQPCWGKVMMKTTRIRVLEDVGDTTVQRLRSEKGVEGRRVVVKKMVYIGDPGVFLKRIVTPQRRAKEEEYYTSDVVLDSGHQAARHNLSPLSSLSSLSDVEGAKTGIDLAAGHANNDVLRADDDMKPETGFQFVLGLELKSSEDSECKVAETKIEQRGACQDVNDAGVDEKLAQDTGVVCRDDGRIDECDHNSNGLNKQDGMPSLKDDVGKEELKVEKEGATRAEVDSNGKKRGGGDKMRSASFSRDSLEDDDVARAILLSLSACNRPANA